VCKKAEVADPLCKHLFDCSVANSDDISSGDECLQYFTGWREMHSVSCISGGQGGPPMEFGR